MSQTNKQLQEKRRIKKWNKELFRKAKRKSLTFYNLLKKISLRQYYKVQKGKGVIAMDDQTPDDPSHAIPGPDANNPPAEKVRIDADVVSNPGPAVPAESTNQPAKQEEEIDEDMPKKGKK